MEKLYNINYGDIKTGDVIRITGVYAKNDNGYFLVEHSVGDNDWCGSNYCLKKMNKNGTFSKAKYSTCFLPIVSYSNNSEYCALSKEHNEKNVNIEIIYNFNMKNVIAYFEEKRNNALSNYEIYCYRFGEDCETTKREFKRADFFKNVLEYVNNMNELKEVEEEPQTTTEPTEAPQPTEQPTAEETTANEPQIAVETATADILPTYYPISEQTARAAKNANSFTDYTAGSATATYKAEVDEVYKVIEEIAEKRPEQAEKAVNMANRYSKKLADYYNAYYRNEASCPSILICGGGNFPTRKKEKQNSRRDSLMKEWQYLQEYKRKIEKLLTNSGIIKSGESNALEQLKSKLEQLEKHQEMYKQVNKCIRMKDTAKGNAELEKLGYTAKEIEQLRTPDFCGRVGYPSYVLTNNNANIKRIKGRIAELEKAKATETTEETATNADGCELFQIVRNTEIMRLQLIFDGKPDTETRNVLKSNGYKWAPSQGAWQRLLNDNAEHSLQRIIEQLTA